MADPLTTIASYWRLEDYAVHRTALDAAGIANVADDAYIIGINWLNAYAVHGIKLRVPVQDADGAREVLGGASEIGEPSPWTEPDAPVGCAACGSEIVESTQRPKHVIAIGVSAAAALVAATSDWLAALPVLLAMALAALAMTRRRCAECGEPR